MISGAAQADVCLLMVPADGNFTTAIQKGDHKAGEVQGQTRQHARLINLLGGEGERVTRVGVTSSAMARDSIESHPPHTCLRHLPPKTVKCLTLLLEPIPDTIFPSHSQAADHRSQQDGH